MEINPPEKFGGFDGSGKFMGGAPGGPPPGDAIFSAMAASEEDDSSENEAKDEHGFFAVGLDFFEKMKKMGQDKPKT